MGIRVSGCSVSDRIFVFCPGGLVTGGPEALHQLADALNRRQPGRAEMMYLPLHNTYAVPAPFRRYRVDAANTRAALSGATVILAETAAHMINVVGAAAQIHMWWLSVDRFFDVAGRDADALLTTAVRRVDKHLYQSEYARQFIESITDRPAAPLGDYLAEEYRRAASRTAGSRRDNIVAYNPVKGAARTEQILAALDPSVQAVPITGMSRNQVKRLLQRAKVYIDFGEHPGKDRIPREAAALGACVLTNRRGAADNDVDYLIDDEYKIDDTELGYETVAATKIMELLDNYAAHQPRFELWRKTISTEDIEFRRDVEASYATA